MQQERISIQELKSKIQDSVSMTNLLKKI